MARRPGPGRSRTHDEPSQRLVGFDGEDIHGSDPRRSWSFPKVRNELFQHRFVTLCPCLDRSVRHVLHPACQAQFVGRMDHGVAVADALDTTSHCRRDCPLICHGSIVAGRCARRSIKSPDRPLAPIWAASCFGCLQASCRHRSLRTLLSVKRRSPARSTPSQQQ